MASPMDTFTHPQPDMLNQSSPGSTTSNNTYTMPMSPLKIKDANAAESYRPQIIRTLGQKPAVLVSASVTAIAGSNKIYAFGGFDQYTDEVYNHVLRLDLDTKQWSLVDNYGDIPGVRMGHTATLWQGNKVIIFGGENEHRSYLADVIIFDVQTAHWHQPDLNGIPPRGRARHSAVIHEDRLFIIGGLSGHDNNQILDDFCYLDLKTWTWSRTWRFVPRFDHTSWIWGDRLWVFGGLTEGMEHVNDLWWLDLKQSPHFNSASHLGQDPRRASNAGAARSNPHTSPSTQSQSTGSGYAANSSSVQVSHVSANSSRRLPMAPGSICAVNFVSGPTIPSQAVGKHYHAYSSGCLLDFATPAVTGAHETSLCALELETMRWEKLASNRDLFNPSYRWHYCAMDPEGTQVWLLGCPTDPAAAGATVGSNEYLSEVLHIDLRKLGLLGNNLTADFKFNSSRLPTSDSIMTSNLSAIGADLIQLFDRAPENGGATDFMITALPDGHDQEGDFEDEEEDALIPLASSNASRAESHHSKPIYVHRLILEARWPHFARMIGAQMAEFHSKKLHLPEPYSVVRAFLQYLYTDSITPQAKDTFGLGEVAGMLVMSDCYEMPRLKLLCRNRLARELDIQHAATIWEKASQANEDWLKRKAAKFCMTHWGYIVRTAAYQHLRKQSLLELSQEIGIEARIISSDDFESRRNSSPRVTFGQSREQRSQRFGSVTTDASSDEDSMEMS